MMRQFVGVIGILLLAPFHSVNAEEATLDSLLRVNSHPMSMDSGALTGEGFEFIMDAAQGVQFLVIAEEHNVGDLSDLTVLLFNALHQRDGFNYLALEQGTVITSWFGDPEHRGNIEAIAALVGKYPGAPTFATDEELRMIAAVGATSSAMHNPIWGVDQEFGALHILDRLAALAPSPEATSMVTELAADARQYEADRSGDIHYLSQVLPPADLSGLSTLFDAEPGTEAEQLISALQRTTRIYNNFALSRQGLLTAYENGREREESMKLRFMEQYRIAQADGDPTPRVIAKLGHWHTYRGIYRAHVPTFGNFLSEFALSNGMHTFILATFVVDSPESWRNTGSTLADAASSAPFTVIDLRPLRPYAHQNRVSDLSETWRDLLFQADAALVIRGGKTGDYKMVKGESLR